MQNRTFIIVAVIVIVIAAVALGSHRSGGGVMHRLGTAIHGGR